MSERSPDSSRATPIRSALLRRPEIPADPAAEQEAANAKARQERDDLDLLAPLRRSMPTASGQAFDWLTSGSWRAFSWGSSLQPRAREFLRARTLIITSPNSGDGKTTLALLLLIELMALGLRFDASAEDIRRAAGARFVPERDLAPPPELGFSRMAEAQAATVLVIDDMGKVGSHPETLRRPKHILETRYDSGETTIITTYLTSAQWSERYDGGNETRYYRHRPDRRHYVIDLAEASR